MEKQELQDDLELRLATTLAPMLLTVSIFSLTIVGRGESPESTITDEILCLLSALCILGAAMVADSALDRVNLSISERFKFLGGGYFLFCLAAGVLSFVIPLLYISRSFPNFSIEGWQYLIYLFSAVSVTSKLMQNEEKAWTVGMFILSATAITLTVFISSKG